jgi:hypothetical protein
MSLNALSSANSANLGFRVNFWARLSLAKIVTSPLLSGLYTAS